MNSTSPTMHTACQTQTQFLKHVLSSSQELRRQLAAASKVTEVQKTVVNAVQRVTIQRTGPAQPTSPSAAPHLEAPAESGSPGPDEEAEEDQGVTPAAPVGAGPKHAASSVAGMPRRGAPGNQSQVLEQKQGGLNK